MSDSGQESIWDIQTAYNVVSGSVATRDYNYREALTPQDSAESIFSKEGITSGETYHYAEPFLTAGDAESTESGAYFARLRHERILNAQYRVSGHSSSPIWRRVRCWKRTERYPMPSGRHRHHHGAHQRFTQE
jgi:type VI secretion system secreted protein VgrG